MLQVKHNKLSFFCERGVCSHRVTMKGDRVRWTIRRVQPAFLVDVGLLIQQTSVLLPVNSTTVQVHSVHFTLVQVNVGPSSFMLETSLLTVNPIVYIASHQNILT